jgi:predicted nucleic acid-binding protein
LIVVDTNVIAYLLIEGEHSALAEAVLDVDPVWSAPLLWRSELRSVIARHLQQAKIDLPTANAYMSDAAALLDGGEFDVDSKRVLELAKLSGCPAYDCEFVYLAETLGVPLVTSDKEVVKAFPQIAVTMRAMVNA